MSSSDAEMVDSGLSDSEPECLQRIRVAADVAAACRRGPKMAIKPIKPCGYPAVGQAFGSGPKLVWVARTTGWSYKR